MDLATVIRYAQIVEKTYGVPPSSLDNAAGKAFTVVWGSSPEVEYAVITTIYANDLATDIRPERGKQRVSIGMVLQDTATGEAVIAIRGTEGIYEWLQDAAFLYVPCPVRGGAGMTDDGFTAMYRSFTILPDPGSLHLVAALSTLPWRVPVTSVTVCGHSLGGALATLTAFDVAANAKLPKPRSFTYASPRTGDATFASAYDRLVPTTCRVVNRLDIVPQTPPAPLYEHVVGELEINPIDLGPPPTVLVRTDLTCEHILTSYLHILTHKAGGPLLPLEATCTPLV